MISDVNIEHTTCFFLKKKRERKLTYQNWDKNVFPQNLLNFPKGYKNFIFTHWEHTFHQWEIPNLSWPRCCHMNFLQPYFKGIEIYNVPHMHIMKNDSYSIFNSLSSRWNLMFKNVNKLVYYLFYIESSSLSFQFYCFVFCLLMNPNMTLLAVLFFMSNLSQCLLLLLMLVAEWLLYITYTRLHDGFPVLHQ